MFGAGAVKFRPMRSGALTGFSPLMVVRFQAFGFQAGPDAADAGVAVAGGVDPTDPSGEVDVGQGSVADRPGPPGVVPGAGHAELRAHEVEEGLVVVGPVRDRSEDHCWSFANQAATFFANSASIRRR